jgi:hypothetical protein
MKPCRECPFRRDSAPGRLGGSPAEVFIGQAHGEFWLPCHLHSAFDDPNWKNDLSKQQCVGAATYRANMCKVPRGKHLLTAAPDRKEVFALPAEFLAHHKRISLEQAGDELAIITPVDHMISELKKATIHIIPKNQTT